MRDASEPRPRDKTNARTDYRRFRNEKYIKREKFALQFNRILKTLPENLGTETETFASRVFLISFF